MEDTKKEDEKKISFVDMKGRVWICRMSVKVCRQLRDEAELDIADVLTKSDKFLRKIVDDQWAFIDALRIVTDQRRNELGIDINDFFETLDGDTIIAARSAFLYGVARMLGEYKRRALESLIPMLDDQIGKAGNLIAKKIEGMEAEIDRKVTTAIESAFGV